MYIEIQKKKYIEIQIAKKTVIERRTNLEESLF